MLIALVGCGLFYIYLLAFPGGEAALHANEVKSMKNARNICLACRQYAREHGGNYPPSFDTLFPNYMQDRLKLISPLNSAEPVGYTYTPPPVARTDSPDTVVIEDKFAPTVDHNRIVVYANGSAQILDSATPAPQ